MIECIDHFVLTVASLDGTCAFYERVLGFKRVDIEGRPTALIFGSQKINLHQADRTFDPKARFPTVGAGDFCFITTGTIEAFLARLAKCSIAVEEGPVERNGARGPMASVYFRDPDGNLVEVSRYHAAEVAI